MAFNNKEHQKRPYKLFNTWLIRIKLTKFCEQIVFIKHTINFIAEFISNPVFIGLITLVQLTAGAVLGANISLAFPTVNYASYNNITLIETIWDGLHPTTIYSVAFAIIITLIRSISDTYINIRDTKRANKKAQELRSLPESLWLKNYHSQILPQVMSINNYIKHSFDSGKFDDDKIIESILDLLEMAKVIAQEWDSQNHEDYSVNLMLYAPSSEQVGEYIKAHWERNKIFFDGNSPYSVANQISGILYVAASVNSKKQFYIHAKNREHTPLILPVCLDESSKNLSRQSLPGAPEAFKNGTYHYIKDLPAEVATWLTEEYWRYFSDAQAQDIYDYYRNDHTGRSIISLPLKLETAVKHDSTNLVFNEKEIFAVVNIYSKEKGMLRENPNDFNEFCRPILSTLALCITAYEIWSNLDEDKNNEDS